LVGLLHGKTKSPSLRSYAIQLYDDKFNATVIWRTPELSRVAIFKSGRKVIDRATAGLDADALAHMVMTGHEP